MFDVLRKKYNELLDPVNRGLSSYVKGVQQRANTTPKYQPKLVNPIIQGIIDLPRSIQVTAQRIPQAINTMVMNPQEAGNLARTAPKYSQVKVPGMQTVANFSANTVQTFGQGLQNMAMGVNKIQKSPGAFNKVVGGVQLLKGAGQTVAPFTSPFQGSNLLSSAPSFNGQRDWNTVQRFSKGIMQGIAQNQDLAPNVQNKNISLDVMGNKIEFDPVTSVGNMVGFVKNPTNQQLFKLTEKFLPAGQLFQGANLERWLAITSLRGSVEDILLDLDKIPENATAEQKVKFMLQSAATGAVSEVVGRGFFDSLGAAGKSTPAQWSKTELVKAFDELKNVSRQWNTPLKRFNPQTGQTEIKPVWKWFIDDQRGFIKPDEFIPKKGSQVAGQIEGKAQTEMPENNIQASPQEVFQQQTLDILKGIARQQDVKGSTEAVSPVSSSKSVPVSNNNIQSGVTQPPAIPQNSSSQLLTKPLPQKQLQPKGNILQKQEPYDGSIPQAYSAEATPRTLEKVKIKTKQAAERQAKQEYKEWQRQIIKQEGTRTTGQAVDDVVGAIKTNTGSPASRNIEELRDLSGFMGGARDVFRNFKAVYGKRFNEVKRVILDPFDAAKGQYVKNLQGWEKSLDDNIVKKFSFKKGSKESAAIQEYGEGIINEAELVKRFGTKKAGQIIEADKWFRSQYDSLLNEINAARAKIYPNQPDKIIPRRADYYRHFREMAEGYKALFNIFETPSGISSPLAGTSDFTKPKSKFLSFAQQRLGLKTDVDAIGGFINYVKAAEYAKNIDPQIANFRNLAQELATQTEEGINKGKLNGFIEYLNDFSNDLAGKTNPLDRAVQKYVPGGRKTFQVINWLNNRAKANTILGNFSSTVAQIFNVPQGIASAGPVNSSRGLSRTLASIFVKNKPMQESTFIRERYSRPFEKFDTGMIDNVKRFAAWMTGVLDEVGTKYIWNSHYEKALREGIGNPVKYADDITRNMVAGRGIGEVPLIQKSKLFQMGAPFQLEVGNLWFVMKDFVDEKRFGALATLFVANYVFNRVAEQVRGSAVTFDPIQATIDAIGELDEENGYIKAGGRLAGEVISNIPGGQTAAAFYPEYGFKVGDFEAPTRKEFFGRADPTRFGSAPLIFKSVQDPFYKLALPFGGGQLKKSVEGAGAYEKGYSESKTGRVRYPIEKDLVNGIKTTLFGEYSTKEARDYFKNERNVLGEKQSETFKQLNQEQRKQYLDSIYKSREQNKLLDSIKEKMENGQSQVDFIADEQGLKGKKRYDFNQQLKGQRKFSDNQINIIKSYDNKQQGLNDTLELRKINSEVNKAKKDLLGTTGSTNQVDATETTIDTSGGNLDLELAKARVKMTKKTERSGNYIIYPTDTGSSTLDLSAPQKGNGIGAFANRDWNITKAREVWNNDQLSKEDKDYALKKLNVKAEDVRYDALANYTNDIKAQYLSSKSDTKEKLIENILSGRKRSIGDNVFASDGVIDVMVDEGRLTKEEAKYLKSIDYNKDGTLKNSSGTGRKRPKPTLPKAKLVKLTIPKAKKVKTIKSKTVRAVKTYKLKAPKFINSRVKKVKRLS